MMTTADPGAGSEPAAAVAALVRLLTIAPSSDDPAAADRARYHSQPDPSDGLRRLFGGQVIAQALLAAIAQIGEDKQVHSLHGYFLRQGDPRQGLLFDVFREFDGGSFANRRVAALQDGQPIFTLSASFHRPEAGLAYASAMPAVSDPEQSRDLRQRGDTAPTRVISPAMAQRFAAFDLREAQVEPSGATARQALWFRLRAPLTAVTARADLVPALLAYVSDFGLIPTVALAHGIDILSPSILIASLDHALWLHEFPDLADWHCYVTETHWTGHARGCARGSMFDTSGRLIATVAQEGLLRQRRA